ncbi:hypothetical protein LCGC14_0935160 [marine sediment metagenome]|uniref:Beta-lactamase n=2 Tax=root TaxID=1 RepID=A0A831QNQ2_9FLAO|nr:class D beta-lactamase [Pricia sp.]HEA20016.1 class D beta-lactamase [Pricia antarctica]
MKIPLILIALICFSSCHKTKKTIHDIKRKANIDNEIVKTEFQSLIDAADVEGAVLLYDFEKDVFYSNNFTWAKEGKLPASTFKIANSIIGLETGVIENDSMIFKWDGKPKGNTNWEQDLVLRDAFHVSCVPCYQDVARNIGEIRMNQYLEQLHYGDMDVDSKTIDTFWLMGDSRISQMQQIDFLKRFYSTELPISERTHEIIKKLLIIEKTNQYRLSGKTGLSNVNEDYNGWFVGYMEMAHNTYFFATNIVPKKDFDFDTFIKKRVDLTIAALELIEIQKD